MTTVGAFNAKTHLNELLRRVSEGETIRITRRGVPIADLVPVGRENKTNLRDLAGEIRQARRGARLGKITIRELIDEGRH